MNPENQFVHAGSTIIFKPVDTDGVVVMSKPQTLNLLGNQDKGLKIHDLVKAPANTLGYC